MLEVDHIRKADLQDALWRPFPGGHHLLRHYAGPGQWAYAVVVHKNSKALMTGFDVGDRSIRIDFLHHRPDMEPSVRSVLFSHLAPDAARYEGSVDEAIYLARNKPRGASLSWIGDMNADAFKPWDKQWTLFQNALDGLGLSLCKHNYDERDERFRCTRKPDGNQGGSDACIDHLAEALNLRNPVSVRVQWKGVPGDHAMLVRDWSVLQQPRKARTSTLWSPSAPSLVSSMAWDCLPVGIDLLRVDERQVPSSCNVQFFDDDPNLSDYHRWEGLIAHVTDITHSHHSHTIKRILSEPFWIKSLRARVRVAFDPETRRKRHADLLRGLRLSRKTRDAERVRHDWLCGKRVWQKPKPLLPVVGLLLPRVSRTEFHGSGSAGASRDARTEFHGSGSAGSRDARTIPLAQDTYVCVDPSRCAQAIADEFMTRWNLPQSHLTAEREMREYITSLQSPPVDIDVNTISAAIDRVKNPR